MGRKKKQDQDDFVTKMKEQVIDVISEPPSKNPFKRFWEWLTGIPRDVKWFLSDLRMRKLKLGTVCWKNHELKTINISWDIHWMSNVYLAAIIRDYLRFFIQNTMAISDYVYEHNPEGYDYWEAQEKLDKDEMFRRWQKIVNDTADLFDVLAKPEEIDKGREQFQKDITAAFDALKEIFYDLEW